MCAGRLVAATGAAETAKWKKRMRIRELRGEERRL